jgi:hypothetical protein
MSHINNFNKDEFILIQNQIILINDLDMQVILH